MRQQLPGAQQARAASARRAAPAAPAPIRPFPPMPGAHPAHPSAAAPAAAASQQAGAHPRTLILREHPLALVSPLLALLALAALVAGAAALLGDPRVLVLGLAGILATGLIRVAAWRTFVISVRYDRVKVRQLRLILVRHTTYALPGFRGLTCEQGIFGRLCDTGTLVIALPDRTLRFALLTPYSEINHTLGW